MRVPENQSPPSPQSTLEVAPRIDIFDLRKFVATIAIEPIAGSRTINESIAHFLVNIVL